MTLPPQIELRARCAEADDLSGIIFEMQIIAGSKNPYNIVTIRLFDPAPLREGYKQLLSWPLFPHQSTCWHSRREWLDYMASCRNDQFTFGGIAARLPETTLLYLSLVALLRPRRSNQSMKPTKEMFDVRWAMFDLAKRLYRGLALFR